MVSWIPYLKPYMIRSYHIKDDDQIDAEESGVNGFLEAISKTIYVFLDTIARSYTKSMLFVYGTIYVLDTYSKKSQPGLNSQSLACESHTLPLGYHAKRVLDHFLKTKVSQYLQNSQHENGAL